MSNLEEGVNNHSFMRYKHINSKLYKTKFTHLPMKPNTNNNMVYQYFQSNKILTMMFQKFFSKSKSKKARLPSRSQEHLSYCNTRNKDKNLCSSVNESNKCSMIFKERQKDRQKVGCFSSTLKQFHLKFNSRKNQLSILREYQTAVSCYEARLPKDMSEETRDNVEENQRIISLCQDDEKPRKKTNQFKQKAEKLKKFVEPSIDQRIKKNFMKRKKQDSRKTMQNRSLNLIKAKHI